MTSSNVESSSDRMDKMLDRITIDPEDFVLQAICNEARATEPTSVTRQSDVFNELLSEVAFIIQV